MAYGKPSRTRSNFGQYQRYATANIKKALRKEAKVMKINAGKIIAEKLEETYKKNVLASYGPRHTPSTMPYKHTNIFINSIHTEIEHEPGIGRDRVKIVFDDDKQYPKRIGPKRQTWS